MIDLQSHSTVSDGELSPAEVAKSAAAAGITVMSLTDHDAIAGVPEASRAAEEAGIENVPAVELSCVHRYSDDLHVLGYWVRLEDIAPACERAQLERVNRAKEIIKRLNEHGVEVSFADAVAEADFVSLHVPLTDENLHLIDAESIAGMRRAPIIVNTARGPLVDMDAAVEALDSGRLGGVALDVTEAEPPPAEHPLRTHPRAVLTPHMAFYSVEAQAELQRRAAEEVARRFRGEPPDRPVNPEVLASS
jgi:hypothetical protein